MKLFPVFMLPLNMVKYYSQTQKYEEVRNSEATQQLYSQELFISKVQNTREISVTMY